MNISLTPHEARVIGCLLEKQRTTPDQYPLSLNTLMLACNQKSSRDPVLELDAETVQDTVDALMKKHLVSEKGGFGSRVTKYQQRFCNTEFGTLKFSEQELGVVCVLLLRGAQTPGELRTRTERLCRFQDTREVESVLERLMQRDDGPFVAKLPREPGRREDRYSHLFGGMPEPGTAAVEVNAGLAPAGTDHAADRLASLEHQLEQLREEVATLRVRLDRLAPEQDG